MSNKPVGCKQLFLENKRSRLQSSNRKILFIIIVALSLLLEVSALSHAADPTQQPLLYASDITYVGSFKLPRPSYGDSADSFDYGGMGLAVSTDGKSLYVGGHVYNHSLGRVAIPDPIGGTASLIQSPVNIPGSLGTPATTELSGALVYNGRLIVQKRQPYDNEGYSGASHAVGSLNISGFTSFTRFKNVGYKQYVSGYMGHIPAEWQTLLGGPAFSGNSTMSINSQCSNGPSFYVFDPDDVGVVDPIPNIPLMYYPYPDHMLADPDVANDLYTRADQHNGGIVFPSGTRSVLFFYTHGYGTPTYKNKTADPCDPSAGGEQAYPYRAQITAFDANDLLAVKNEYKKPWEIKPYAWWEIPGPIDVCNKLMPSGIAYDPNSGRIYGTLRYGESPKILVWQVNRTPQDVTPGSTVLVPPRNFRIEGIGQ